MGEYFKTDCVILYLNPMVSTLNKKILLLIDSLGPGGAQRQLVGLACFLKARDYDVIVAAYHDNRFYVDQLLTNGVPYVYIKKAQRGLLRQWYLMRFIRKVNPNVVISYLESPSVRACVAHMFNRKYKLIVSERNTTQQTGRAEKLRFNLFRLADYVVPNAYAQEDYIKQTFPILNDKIVTIPNFVDLDYFVPPLERNRKAVPSIIVVATIWASKNTLGFIDAVAELKKRGCKFHISWYGKVESSIDYFNQCQKKLKELNIADVIELKEKTTKIKECYQKADYFCLPSFYEGTPNVICEAMACGLPVACSDVCDNGRYVVEGENGFLFNPKDIKSIANSIEKMLALDKVRYNNYCKASRVRAVEMLSKGKFVDSYIKLIEQ